MTQLNAFVGHSFAPDDHEVVDSFLKYFNQLKAMEIGFTWESAEPAEPKDLADKVLNVIKDKNVFIGICTRKEAVIGAEEFLLDRKTGFHGKPPTGSYRKLG